MNYDFWDENAKPLAIVGTFDKPISDDYQIRKYTPIMNSPRKEMNNQ